MPKRKAARPVHDERPLKDRPGYFMTEDACIRGPRKDSGRVYFILGNCNFYPFDWSLVFSDDEEWKPIPDHSGYELHRTRLRARTKHGWDLVAYVRIGKDTNLSLMMMHEQHWLLPEQRRYAVEVAALGRQYPGLNFDDVFTVPPESRSHLLCIRNPILFEYWHDKQVQVGTVAGKSSQEVTWKHAACGKTWRQAINRVVDRDCPCPNPKCRQASRAGSGNQSNVTGVSTENWMVDQLRAHDEVEHVERIGHLGNDIADVVVRLKSSPKRRLLQVKTLTIDKKASQPNLTYAMPFERRSTGDYPPNLLIAAVSKSRDRMFIVFPSELDGQTAVSVSWSTYARGSAGKKYTETLSFINALVAQLANSVADDELNRQARHSATYLVEMESRDRFRLSCARHQLEYKDHEDACAPIDMYVNGKAVQHKCTGYRVHNVYVVNCHRAGNRPYSLSDNIDVLTVEIAEYPNQFLNIPRIELLRMGVLKTDDVDGKTSLYVRSPTDVDYQLHQYWNNYQVFF